MVLLQSHLTAQPSAASAQSFVARSPPLSSGPGSAFPPMDAGPPSNLQFKQKMELLPLGDLLDVGERRPLVLVLGRSGFLQSSEVPGNSPAGD